MRKGWEIKKLGEVCRYDKTPNRKAELPYIGLEHIESQTGKFIGTLEVQKVKSSTFYFSDKHVLYGRLRPYLNKVLLPFFEGHCSTEIFPILVNKELDRKFLFYWLISEKTVEKINATWTGARMPRANMNTVLNFDFFYPSISEQQRIVAILEEAFEAIDQAKANTEKNLQNAKEMFQSELNSIFTNKGEGWVEKKLNEVCEVKDGTHDSPRYIPDGIPFVTQKNIRLEGLSFENTRFITQTDHEKFYKRSNVAFGDILISMIGANRGMACIVDDERIFSIKNVGLVKANKNINQNYLLYFLKSQRAVSYVKSFSKGGAQEFIGLTELRSFPIPIAPANDQQRIVNQLNTLSAETKQLEENYRKKLESLEELKKSILQKAFSGELTRQTTEIEMEQLDLVAEDQAKYQS